MSRENIRARELGLGRGVDEDIEIEFKHAAGVSNKKIKYDQASGSIQFGDDNDGFQNLGTGGGGGINYVTNPGFELNAVDGVTAGTSGGVVPTTGEEIGSPLFGTRSSKVTSGAGTGFVDHEIAGIDNAIIEGGILNYVLAYLKTDSGVAEGDWTVGIYNITDATYATTQTDLKVDVLNVYQETFVPIAGKTYVLRVEFTDTTSGRILIVDQLAMTPDSSAALINPEADSQLKVAGGNGHGSSGSNIRLFVNLEVDVGPGITYESDPTNGDRFVIQEDGVYDMSYTDGRTAGGILEFGISVNTTQIGGAIASIPTLERICISTIQSPDYSNCAVSRLLVAGDIVRAHTSGAANQTTVAACNFTITQAEKTSKVNLITPNLLRSNDAVEYLLNTGVVAANVAIDFSVEQTEFTIGNWTSTAGVITVPSDGHYQVTMGMRSPGMVAGVEFYLDVNESGIYRRLWNEESAVATYRWVSASIVVFVSKGDTISIKNTTGDDLSTGIVSWLQIMRRPEIGAHKPVGFGIATENTYGLVKKTNSQVKVNGAATGAAAGHGNTDTHIRRFTTLSENVGTAITYAVSAANGSTFTINEDGVYGFTYADGHKTSGTWFGLSVNSNQLTTPIYSITVAHVVALHRYIYQNPDDFENCAGTMQLSAGDVVRVHTDGNTNSDVAGVMFRVTQITAL